MSNPLVSIIIVNWNGMRYLKDCLESLSKSTYKNVEIFFVDNASTDESISYAEKSKLPLQIIRNKKNLGYAEGHEIAFKKAKGAFVLLLSMDTIVMPTTIEVMVKTMCSEETIGAVQPKLLMYPEKNLIDSIGSFFLFSGMLYHFGREKKATNPLYNKQMEIFSAKGACLLFRKDMLEKTGLFDKDFFAYYEETDLCHRVWLAGYRIVYIPDAVCYHTGGGASGKMVPSYIQFHAYKNRLCSLSKNLSLSYLLRVLPATLFIYQLATIMYLATGKPAIALAVQKSILWNITHISETLKKRKVIQTKTRVLKDSDFLPRVIKPVRLSYYYYLFKGLGLYKD